MYVNLIHLYIYHIDIGMNMHVFIQIYTNMYAMYACVHVYLHLCWYYSNLHFSAHIGVAHPRTASSCR
jgi:hypothetical protein